MSLLTICQDAASQLGLRQPSAIVGSTSLTAQLLLRHANAGVKSLIKYHDWQGLIVVKSHTTLAAQAQTGALPTDYARMTYNVEIWDTTNTQRYIGPTSQRIWRQLSAQAVAGVSGYWRIIGGVLQLYPAPAAGQTLEFEYITKNGVLSASMVGKPAFTADTDTCVIDEELVTLEAIWRYRHGRGYAQYAEDMKSCEIEKEKAASTDRGTGRIRPASNSMPPDPTWDGTITEAP